MKGCNYSLLVNVAKMYYEKKLSQAEIAVLLNLSRPTVSRLLAQAEKKGIVQIRVVDYGEQNSGLAEALRHKLNLRYVEVLPGVFPNADAARHSVAERAAIYCNTAIKNGMTVGLGWGRSIRALMEVIKFDKPKRIKIVPVFGEGGTMDTYSHLNEMVFHMKQVSGGTAYFLHAPAFCSSEKAVEALTQDPDIKNIIEIWGHLDFLITGIGTNPPAPFLNLLHELQKYVLSDKSVGDICLNYFDIEGNIIEFSQEKRLVGIRENQLRNVKEILTLGSGKEKGPAIVGGARAGLIHSLIVDETAALAALALL